MWLKQILVTMECEEFLCDVRCNIWRDLPALLKNVFFRAVKLGHAVYANKWLHFQTRLKASHYWMIVSHYRGNKVKFGRISLALGQIRDDAPPMHYTCDFLVCCLLSHPHKFETRRIWDEWSLPPFFLSFFGHHHNVQCCALSLIGGLLRDGLPRHRIYQV